MRLLYISICSKSLNPTYALFPAMLRLSGDVVFYGPGFVDEWTLNRGIEAFVDARDKFDIHVINLLGADFGNENWRYFERYMCPPYRSEMLKSFAADIGAFLERSRVPKAFVLIGQDSYALGARKAKWIAETDAYFVAWAGGFSRPMEELDVIKQEDFYKKKSSAKFTKKAEEATVFGRWHDVVSSHDKKFINLGHFIAETEFDWRALDGRSDNVIVPGQMYVRRKAARQGLAKNDMLARSGRFKFLLSVLDHLGFRPYTRPTLYTLYNQIFVSNIAATRYAYTDGYGYDRPARKYFEIPALGTILMCSPCAGFSDLGFEDRKNAIVCPPDAILDALAWLRNHPDEAQRIAEAGRSLIWQQHSLHARAEQFARCVNSIVGGRYTGSRWVKGQFDVLEAPAVKGTGLQ